MHDFDPDQVALRGGHFIGGRHVPGIGAPMPVARPSDARIYSAVPTGSPDEVDDAVESARRAFRESDWARCAPRERARILRRWADLIEADVEPLGRIEALGSTRPIQDVVNWDIPFTADGMRFFAEFADKIGGEVAATRSDHLGFTIAEPYGVIAAIAPWNFPLVMASWKVGPALAAGNAVVVKPSELTPFSVLRLAELAIAAGVPDGIFNVVQGDGRTTGNALCRHPGIGKITFTGSTRTGAAIMTASAETGIKPVILELGGKSPQVVFADVPDLGKVAATVARAITGNAGQVCVAGSRLIVQDEVAEPLVDRIAEAFRQLKPGPTWRSDTTLSPIISARQADRVDAIVHRTVKQGAELRCGGHRAPAPQDGAYYLPTILTGVRSDMEAAREEVFGPVLTVETFADEEEAFALADHPVYGLAAGVHTSDMRRAMRAVRRIEAGTVWINRYGRTADFAIPTGGYKGSGIGKDLGRQAVEANLRFKSVLIDCN